jgi:methionine aminopeptidase
MSALEQELWNLVATVGHSLAPGQTTAEIDARLTAGLRAMRATSTYPTAGFPATNAVSLTEEIANGVPSDRRISDGDLVRVIAGSVTTAITVRRPPHGHCRTRSSHAHFEKAASLGVDTGQSPQAPTWSPPTL